MYFPDIRRHAYKARLLRKPVQCAYWTSLPQLFKHRNLTRAQYSDRIVVLSGNGEGYGDYHTADRAIAYMRQDMLADDPRLAKVRMRLSSVVQKYAANLGKTQA